MEKTRTFKCGTQVQKRERKKHFAHSPNPVCYGTVECGVVQLGTDALSAQHGHVPFGLKEGRARCTTLWR
jgi:hypothetical protein